MFIKKIKRYRLTYEIKFEDVNEAKFTAVLDLMLGTAEPLEIFDEETGELIMSANEIKRYKDNLIKQVSYPNRVDDK